MRRLAEPRGLLVCALAAAGLLAAAAFGAESASGEKVTVDLEYMDAAQPIDSFHVPLGAVAGFKKEPDFAGHEVDRQIIQLGTDTNYHIGIAVDLTARRVYLDTNLNGDLTDDSQTSFEKPPPGRPWTFITASNLALAFKTPAGMHRLAADMRFLLHRSVSVAYVNSRSYLQGRAVLAGQEWQVGVVRKQADETPVYLLARPWQERDRPFAASNGPDLVSFSEKVLLGGHAYRVQGQPVTRDGAAGYRLEFTEQQPKLGVLRVSGEHVHRLILWSQGDYVAVLDKPAPAAKVPVGTYAWAAVCLRKDKDAVQFMAKTMRVEENATVSLTAGGPLRGSVAIERLGSTLQLDHKYVGVDGGSYATSDGGRPEGPKVRVLLGEKEVAEGQFTYG